MLERKRTVHFHCHRADDIMTAVRLAEEFGFELVLQHCTEGYRVADELAKRKIPVSLTLIDSPGGKPEATGLLEENAAILDKAGVKVAINTDDFITESRFFLRTGAIAVRGGMSEDAALQGADAARRRDAAPRRPPRLAREGQGRRLRRPVRARRSASTRRCWKPTSTATSVFDRAGTQDWTYQAGGFALADRTRLPPTPAADQAAAGRVKAPALPTNGRRSTERRSALPILRRPHSHRRPAARSPTASSWSRTARSRRSGRATEVAAARRTCRC